MLPVQKQHLCLLIQCSVVLGVLHVQSMHPDARLSCPLFSTGEPLRRGRIGHARAPMPACAACRDPRCNATAVHNCLTARGGLANALTKLANDMDARVMVRLVEAEKGAEASLKAIVQEGTEWCKATIATALDPATQQQGQSHFCCQLHHA